MLGGLCPVTTQLMCLHGKHVRLGKTKTVMSSVFGLLELVHLRTKMLVVIMLLVPMDAHAQ